MFCLFLAAWHYGAMALMRELFKGNIGVLGLLIGVGLIGLVYLWSKDKDN